MALSKEHKAKIKTIIEHLKEAKENLDDHLNNASTAVAAAEKELEEFKNKIEEEYEEMSEKVQEGDKGQALQILIENIDTAIEYVQSLQEELDKDFFEDIGDHFQTMLED